MRIPRPFRQTRLIHPAPFARFRCDDVMPEAWRWVADDSAAEEGFLWHLNTLSRQSFPGTTRGNTFHKVGSSLTNFPAAHIIPWAFVPNTLIVPACSPMCCVAIGRLDADGFHKKVTRWGT